MTDRTRHETDAGPAGRTPDEPVHVIVDAHVHVHDCYEPGEFLDHAFSNLRNVAESLGGPSRFAAVLILTETAEADYFSRFAAGTVKTPGWRFARTDEPWSVIARRDDDRLAIVAGRQVAGAEDLEVLMLGTAEKVDDGRPIRELLQEGARLGAARVVPWGPGKWFFSRGRLIGDVIRSMQGEEFFLGDEGGRPVFWPTPTRFQEAGRLGVRVLRGTDPLPFPWEVRRVGSFGFWASAPFDWSKPWTSLRPSLNDPEVALRPFGRLERPIRFFRNQYGMQMRKRRRAR